MMREQLVRLREQMRKAGVSAYLIQTCDCHGSEYVGDYFKCRAYISGFTGSAGTLVVMEDQAGLWTDGRYFLQAEDQLKGSGITLYKMEEPGVPTVEEFLEKEMEHGQTLGFDGRCVMSDYAEKLEQALLKKGVSFASGLDLVGDVWEDRPAMSKKPVWMLPDAYAGESRAMKIRRLRESLSMQGVNYVITSSLESICWLLNVRGDDVECTPVVLSYVIVGQNRIVWYVQAEAISEEVRAHIQKDGVTIAPYEQIYQDVAYLPGGCRVLYDPATMNRALEDRLNKGAEKVKGEDPCIRMKAIKNEVEIANEKRAHIKDGVAVTRFLYWLKHLPFGHQETEISVAKHLESLREEQELYVEPSFTPIVGYGPHGAIVHYSATEESSVRIGDHSFLLVDSGGHYLEGTTDITRTIAMGPLTWEEKECYTAVLRGHINLAMTRFLKGCTGRNLDILARTPLWELGLDYKHGTGHGVGYLLSVHEGPTTISVNVKPGSPRDCAFKEGMLCSNEPGYYAAGKFGIRLENLIVCVPDTRYHNGRFLKFDTITMVPFDLDAILPEQMTKREREWLNAYHQTVYDTIAPLLTVEEEIVWLKEATRAI